MERKSLYTSLFFVALFALISAYTFHTARQDLKYHSCHLPLTADTDELIVAGCDRIMRVSEQGTIIDEAKYDELGLSPQIYSIDVGSDGQVWIADMGNQSIFSCNKDLQNCEKRRGLGRGYLKRPFSLRLFGDQMWAADPGNDRVVSLGGGLDIDLTLQDDFNYPNDLFLTDEELIVADSANQRLVVFDIGSESKPVFRQAIELGTLQQPISHTHPLSITRTENGVYWTILADGLMVGQEAIRISNDTDDIVHYSFPDDAEPFSLAVLKDRVLVGDPASETVFELQDGGQVAVFAPGSELANVLEAHAADGDLVRWRFRLGLLGLALSLCVGVFLISRRDNANSADKPRSVAEVFVTRNDPRIHWIVPETTRGIWLSLAIIPLFLLPIALIVPRLVESDSALSTALWQELEQWGVFAIVLLMVVSMRVATRRQGQQRLGVLDDILIHENSKKQLIAVTATDIDYSDNVIFFNNHAVNLGTQGGMATYPSDELVKHVYPVLAKANYISPNDAQRRIMTIAVSPHILYAFLAFVIVMFAVIIERFFI